MSGYKERAASPSGSKLQPTVLHDTLGAYISVIHGSLSGNLYLSKIDESDKSQSKCVVVSGKWYSPPEFETLTGKKARKWRQSLNHQGRTLPLLSLLWFTWYSGLFSGWSAGLVSWTCQLAHKMLNCHVQHLLVVMFLRNLMPLRAAVLLLG